MASLLETLRNSILTSIHGRRLGLTRDDFLVGPKDLQRQVEDITTTAATSCSPYGITRITTAIVSTAPISNTLQAPVPGVEKTLFNASTSTGANLFTLTGAGLYLTSGTSLTGISLIGQGACIKLVGLTTALWGLANGSTIVPSNVTTT